MCFSWNNRIIWPNRRQKYYIFSNLPNFLLKKYHSPCIFFFLIIFCIIMQDISSLFVIKWHYLSLSGIWTRFWRLELWEKLKICVRNAHNAIGTALGWLLSPATLDAAWWRLACSGRGGENSGRKCRMVRHGWESYRQLGKYHMARFRQSSRDRANWARSLRPTCVDSYRIHDGCSNDRGDCLTYLLNRGLRVFLPARNWIGRPLPMAKNTSVPDISAWG